MPYGNFTPKDYVPRGAAWPASKWAQTALALTMVPLFFPIGCETRHGTVSRIERATLPKRRRGDAANVGAILGAGVSVRYGLIHLEEMGDVALGYAMSPKLGRTKVGDEITVKVRPDTGFILRLKNHSNPRRWWEY